MNIAALSMGLNQAGLQQAVTVALTKNVMETAQANNQQMLQMLETSTREAPHPTSGQRIDLKG